MHLKRIGWLRKQLLGSSKRGTNRSPYKLTQSWKLLCHNSGGRLQFRTLSVNPPLFTQRQLLHGTLLRVKPNDRRRAPTILPILIEEQVVTNGENWDAKWGTFVWKQPSDYAATVFSCLPTTLNKKFQSWYIVLRSAKDLQKSSEDAYRAFVQWSKVGYLEIEKKSRREYWIEADVRDIVNPSKIFLKNCTEPLLEVCIEHFPT